jgi:hypothetical protein
MFATCLKCGCEDVEFDTHDETAECPECGYVGAIECDADCQGDPPEFVPYYTLQESPEDHQITKESPKDHRSEP